MNITLCLSALFALQATNIAYFLVLLLVFLIVLGTMYYLINTLAPEPIRRYGIAVVVVLAVIFLVYLLLSLVGAAPPLRF
jgi:hypothetical protein